MKKAMQTFLTILAGLVLLLGLSNLVTAKPKPKADICHVTDSGEVLLLNVSENAVPAHLNHGDFLPSTSNDCNPVEPPSFVCPCWNAGEVNKLQPTKDGATLTCFSPLDAQGKYISFGFVESGPPGYFVRMSADYDYGEKWLSCNFYDNCPPESDCQNVTNVISGTLTDLEFESCKAEVASVAYERSGCEINTNYPLPWPN